MGTFGVIFVSAIWGLVCGFLDIKYKCIITNKAYDIDSSNIHKEFTMFEYFYLYTGAFLISESHRGDFGAASLEFVLEIVLVGLLLMLFTRKYNRKK